MTLTIKLLAHCKRISKDENRNKKTCQFIVNRIFTAIKINTPYTGLLNIEQPEEIFSEHANDWLFEVKK